MDCRQTALTVSREQKIDGVKATLNGYRGCLALYGFLCPRIRCCMTNEVKMTSDEFNRWLARSGLRKAALSRIFGISRSTIDKYLIEGGPAWLGYACRGLDLERNPKSATLAVEFDDGRPVGFSWVPKD